jgi:uncharacterized membrane protein (DUF106 family)
LSKFYIFQEGLNQINISGNSLQAIKKIFDEVNDNILKKDSVSLEEKKKALIKLNNELNSIGRKMKSELYSDSVKYYFYLIIIIIIIYK